MEEDLSRVLEPANAHPSPQDLLALLEDGHAEAQRLATQAHLETCRDCPAELAAVRGTETLLRAGGDERVAESLAAPDGSADTSR